MALVTNSRIKLPASNNLTPVTLRDFSGLWDPADNDLNLQSKFLTKAINIERATDGALQVRYGYRKFVDTLVPRSFTGQMHVQPNTDRQIVTSVNHKLSVGSVVNFTNVIPGSYLGLTASVLSLYLVVVSIQDNDNFTVLLPQWTISGTPIDIGGLITEQPSQGNVLDIEYFENFLVCATDKGYIVAVDSNKVTLTLWSPRVVEMQTMATEIATATLATTLGFNTVTVDTLLNPNPIKIGDLVTLAGYPLTGGIPAAEINRTHYVSDVIGTKVQIQLQTLASSSSTNSAGTLNYSASAAWSVCTYVSHAVSNRQLIFCNGIDKPVKVDFAADQFCSFLVDPVGNNNLNTPVCKYVAAGSNFTVMAGDPTDPGAVYISSTDTNNTWFIDEAHKDADPNDATKINADKLANTSDPAVTGIAFHRGLLFITFNNTIIVMQLGIYDTSGETAAHTPQLVDTLQNYGCISHKSLMSVGDNFFAVDYTGVLSIAQNIITTRFRPQRTSELITPAIAKRLSILTNGQPTWGVYDKRANKYWWFVPVGANKFNTYVLNLEPARKIQGWNECRELDFTCGCRSTLDRLFVCRGSVIYELGNDSDPIYSDDGLPIKWMWELPWMDFSKKAFTKQSRYLAMDTQGTGRFTVQMFVDRILENVRQIDEDLTANPATEYDEFTLPVAPERQMDLLGGGSKGYGAGSQPYGGGRRTARAKMLAWNALFQVAKFRFTGLTSEPLKFISLTLLYLVGSMKR